MPGEELESVVGHDWVEEQLQKLPFVDWDRYTSGEWDDEGDYVNVYGWIDREDDYKDFVVLILWTETEVIYFTTSSSERTEEIHAALFDEPVEEHNDCQRIEDAFDVENAIRLATDGGTAKPEIEHEPHSSADFDDMDYVDERGIRIFDQGWTCPNCGDDGELMFRPGSKNTCATCFWVLNGQYNDYIFDDWPLKYRHAQRLLAELGDDWHGTPGSVSTRLRQHFDRPVEAVQAFEGVVSGEISAAGTDGVATLGDFT